MLHQIVPVPIIKRFARKQCWCHTPKTQHHAALVAVLSPVSTGKKRQRAVVDTTEPHLSVDVVRVPFRADCQDTPNIVADTRDVPWHTVALENCECCLGA